MTKEQAQIKMYVLTERCDTLQENAQKMFKEFDKVMEERRKLLAEFPTLELGVLKDIEPEYYLKTKWVPFK